MTTAALWSAIDTGEMDEIVRIMTQLAEANRARLDQIRCSVCDTPLPDINAS